MKSMSRRLSLKAGKSSKSGKASKSSKGKASLADAVPNYAWQGEEVSALDGLLGGEHASANVHDDRRYVRQKVVGSADMLTPAVVPKDERSPRQLHVVCVECIKISAENHRLHSELDGLRDEHLVKMAELRQLEAERNSLHEVNTLTSRDSDRYRSDLETLHARHSALTEDYENTSSELMSLSAQLDALQKSHQLAANESLHEEKQALEHKLQELQEQLCDRGTMVREIKQRNEILYDKLQKETKVG